MVFQAGNRLLTEQDHKGRSWQMDEHALDSLLTLFDGELVGKDIVAGSPREITCCVGV